MICQRKQIQKRRLTDHLKNQPEQTYKPHAFWSIQSQKNHKPSIFHEKNYQIDPWHIKSNAKFDEIPSKHSAQIFQISANQTRKFNHFHNSKVENSQRKFIKDQSSQNKLEVTEIIGSPYLFLEEKGSPAKIDMLQCSIRFQQYEQLRAEQMKSIFMSKIILPDAKKSTFKSPQQNNFIKRNIKYAFQVENGRNDRNLTFEKKRTIQETKQQLILNRQKLQQESKQIFRVISMKDQKPGQRSRPKSQTENRENNFVPSVWNLSYIQKASNPQTKLSRKSYSNITQWKKILQNKHKSSNTQERDHQIHSNKVKSSLKDNQQKDIPKNIAEQKNSRSLSKKLARMWKVKNKSTLVIPSSSEAIQNEEKPTQKDVHFHARIHSVTFRGDQSKFFRKVSKDQFQTIEAEGFTQFESVAISKLFGVKSEKISRKASKSLALNGSRGLFSQREKGRKIKPHETQKRFMSKNFCIQGSTCEMSQLFAD